MFSILPLSLNNPPVNWLVDRGQSNWNVYISKHVMECRVTGPERIEIAAYQKSRLHVRHFNIDSPKPRSSLFTDLKFQRKFYDTIKFHNLYMLKGI